jgi:hypothetical protein
MKYIGKYLSGEILLTRECIKKTLKIVVSVKSKINGTAMGTKMAPSYANIFMGDLEERLLLSSLKQPLSWFRFIDDVDMNWIHSDKELDAFLEHANSIHPSIKFTHEVSPGHSLDDFSRSKIYIIDHNPSWKENQRQ